MRRSLLSRAVLPALALFSGCLSQAALVEGVNETLEIRNNYSKPVSLEITFRKDSRDQRPTVFDETVKVGATQTKTLDVLGDSQYYLTVTRGGRTHEFGTRPICDAAFTRIIVMDTGDITSEIEDCE